MEENQEQVIEAFIVDLDAAWEKIKPQLTGLLFPEASRSAKYRLAAWLRGSEKLKEGTPPTPDGFGGWHKNPQWLVVCDISNNPPSDQATNRLSVMVHAQMFRQIVCRHLEAGPE